MAPPICARSREGDLPLSFAQQRIWVFNHLNPDIPIFNTFKAYKIEGPLNIDALTQSLSEIIRRHEALRTAYPNVDGNPKPLIMQELNVRLEVKDIRQSLASEHGNDINTICNQFISEPIDLYQGPIFRAELLKIGNDQHILVMVSHQIIFDGASWSILSRELTQLYEAFCSNETSPLKALPLQYIDFTGWQMELLQGEVLNTLSSFWKQQLDGDLPLLNLPTRNTSNDDSVKHAESLPFSVSREVADSLKQLSSKEGVTLFTVLLAAFNVLLSRYANQNDLMVFTSVPSRTRAEIRNLIGLFSNFIPLRMQLNSNQQFSDLLIQAQEVYSGALGHQDMPFEYILKELQSEQKVTKNSLFQTLFIFENATKKPLRLANTSVTPLNLTTGLTKFDLTLFVEEKQGELSGSIRYKSAMYDTSMIEQMIGQYKEILKQLVKYPNQTLRELPGLTESERNELLAAQSRENEKRRETSSPPNLVRQQSYKTPQTKMESQIAGIWQEVLGIDKVGIQDNFFELGGDSMLLVILIGKLEDALKKEFSVIDIFRNPTISSFVLCLTNNSNESHSYNDIYERVNKKKKALKRQKKSRAYKR